MHNFHSAPPWEQSKVCKTQIGPVWSGLIDLLNGQNIIKHKNVCTFCAKSKINMFSTSAVSDVCLSDQTNLILLFQNLKSHPKCSESNTIIMPRSLECSWTSDTLNISPKLTPSRVTLVCIKPQSVDLGIGAIPRFANATALMRIT